MFVHSYFLRFPFIRMWFEFLCLLISSFLWLLINVMPSYNLYIVIRSSFGFTSLGCYPRSYLILCICSFAFSSFRCHPSSYLCSFLVPLVSNCWGNILVSIYVLVPLVPHHWDVILWSLIIGMSILVLSIFILSSFSVLSLGCDPRFYLSLFICSFYSHHWDVILGSIYV